MIELLEYPTPSVFDENNLQDMLVGMSEKGGSDLFIMGNGQIWLSIHGRKEKVTNRKISDNEVERLIEAIYGENAKSILGSRKPIDTQYEFKTSYNDDGITRKKRYRFRINAVNSIRKGRTSITITIRTIPTTPPTVQEIGVEQELIDITRQIDQGLILVVGATGNGKSTLLASIIRDQLEDPDGHRNIVTIEHPIEFVYDYVESPSSFVTPLEVGKGIESFNDGVINSLRMAPTTILVGEARDYETISSAINASVTGHVVFSTVHANSVAETFQRMISEYPPDMQGQAKYSLVQAVKVVVAQRLIPTVDGKRTAIREYLILNQRIKDQLSTSKNIGQKANEMVAKYGKPMMSDVESKFKAGIISEKVYNRMIANYAEEMESLNNASE